MEAVIKKWGNSLGIRIPNSIARELSLENGSFVDIRNKGDEMIIKPIQKNKLLELLDKITGENMHEEIEFIAKESPEKITEIIDKLSVLIKEDYAPHLCRP